MYILKAVLELGIQLVHSKYLLSDSMKYLLNFHCVQRACSEDTVIIADTSLPRGEQCYVREVSNLRQERPAQGSNVCTMCGGACLLSQ